MRRQILLILLTSALLSCEGPSAEEYRHEGQAIARSLCELLKPINSGKELEEAAPQLKRHFNGLAELAIFASKRDDHHELTPIEVALCEQLRLELNRVCQLSGGLEIVEKCQEEAFYRLAKQSCKKGQQSGS